MGRADRFIESAAEYQVLARRLLGRTWLVDRLVDGAALAQSVGRGLEFVTSDGELVAADGTVIVGPRQAATGMLSRRSELRACHEQAAELEQQLATQTAAHAQLDKSGHDRRSWSPHRWPLTRWRPASSPSAIGRRRPRPRN